MGKTWNDLSSKARRIYNSCVLRSSTFYLGMMRWNKAHLIHDRNIQPLDASAFKDDLTFDWFLSSGTKREMVQQFLNLIKLADTMHDVGALAARSAGLELENTAAELTADSPSILGTIDDLHRCLEGWSATYQQDLVIQPQSNAACDESDQRALVVQRSYITICYV